MAKGANINIEKIEQYPVTDTCFRIITAYRYEVDGVVTRIDCKIQNRQYSVGLGSTTPIAPKPGAPFSSNDDLITPKAGIMECLNVKVSKSELIRALKELVSDLESDA